MTPSSPRSSRAATCSSASAGPTCSKAGSAALPPQLMQFTGDALPPRCSSFGRRRRRPHAGVVAVRFLCVQIYFFSFLGSFMQFDWARSVVQ